VGHETASQTQPPLKQRCPERQAWQLPPAVPQVSFDIARQRLSSQHPVGHESALHTHVSPTQACPEAHAPLPPQVQVPVREHASAPTPQLVQGAPPTPQVAVDGWRHTFPSQQPDGQDSALHTQALSTHRCSAVQRSEPQTHSPEALQAVAVVAWQEAQVLPLVPQVSIERSRQTFPSQQPPGHETASHRH